MLVPGQTSWGYLITSLVLHTVIPTCRYNRLQTAVTEVDGLNSCDMLLTVDVDFHTSTFICYSDGPLTVVTGYTYSVHY